MKLLLKKPVNSKFDLLCSLSSLYFYPGTPVCCFAHLSAKLSYAVPVSDV